MLKKKKKKRVLLLVVYSTWISVYTSLDC